MMQRNLSTLVGKEYDLIIVGGGIFGICATWDAALRGLSVALVEKADFAHATSANCFKIVHGGFRYLQHGDLYRIRESSRELSSLLRIAPHLVYPIPIVIPTYGYGMQGKEVLRAALLAYDLITLGRNRGLREPQRQIPPGRCISRQECLRMFPDLKKEGLTGAVLFYDGQMYSPPRLALSFLKSAVKAGADVANYLKVTGFLRKGNKVFGITARDILTGNGLEIRGKVVLNAAGPWAERLLWYGMGIRLCPELSYSRDAYVIVARRLTENYALAVQGKTKDPDAFMSRGRRHLFIVPWRNHTLIGVWHSLYRGDPDTFTVTEKDLQGFLDEINEAYPALALTRKDVSLWNSGLVLFGDNLPGAIDLSYGKRSIIIDHAKVHKVDGLITLIGVRYTTARGVAAKTVDLICEKLERKGPRSKTATIPIYGGQIDQFATFLRHGMEQRPSVVRSEAMEALLHNHGSEYREVLKYIEKVPRLAETIGSSTVMKAEVVHAVREEMALKLADVVFRRTDLCTGGYPGDVALRTCVDLMASGLGWDKRRIQEEIEAVKSAFPWSILPDVYRSEENGRHASERESRVPEERGESK